MNATIILTIICFSALVFYLGYTWRKNEETLDEDWEEFRKTNGVFQWRRK